MAVQGESWTELHVCNDVEMSPCPTLCSYNPQMKTWDINRCVVALTGSSRKLNDSIITEQDRILLCWFWIRCRTTFRRVSFFSLNRAFWVQVSGPEADPASSTWQLTWGQTMWVSQTWTWSLSQNEQCVNVIKPVQLKHLWYLKEELLELVLSVDLWLCNHFNVNCCSIF